MASKIGYLEEGDMVISLAGCQFKIKAWLTHCVLLKLQAVKFKKNILCCSETCFGAALFLLQKSY